MKINGVLAAGLIAATSSFGLLSQVPAFAADATPAMSQPATPSTPQAQSSASAKHAAMSRANVEQVQQALNGAGEKTTVDGKWGPKTEAALKQFQQQHGIKATGRLDQATKKQLHATG